MSSDKLQNFVFFSVLICLIAFFRTLQFSWTYFYTSVCRLFFFEVCLILDLRILSEWEVLGKSPKQFFPIGKNRNLWGMWSNSKIHDSMYAVKSLFWSHSKCECVICLCQVFYFSVLLHNGEILPWFCNFICCWIALTPLNGK